MQIDPKATESLNAMGAVGILGFPIAGLRMKWQRREDEAFDLIAGQGRILQRIHLSIDDHGRRSVCQQQQVAPLALDKTGQPVVQARAIEVLLWAHRVFAST
jgi:3-methyladenine DNA glycosylase Mpg